MILEIRTYPDPVLRQVAEPVETFDESLERLVRDMAETMYAAPGVGLAAPQVGVSRRLYVIDTTSPEGSDLHVFVNPEIVEKDGRINWNEGCLSFPDVFADVDRARRVLVRAQNVEGETFELRAEDLLAVAVQHELDHLDGRLLIDNVPFLERALVKRKLTRMAIESSKPF